MLKASTLNFVLIYSKAVNIEQAKKTLKTVG